MAAQLPDYDDLPLNETLGMRYAWDLWGESGDLGTINLLTPELVARAAAQVRTGRVFSLSLPLDTRCSAGRPPYRHTIFRLDRNTQDDVVDNFFLQGTTQWDGLRHIQAREFGFYNGVQPADAGPGGGRLGIESWAEHGIAGRGVLVDVEGYLRGQGSELEPTAGFAVSADLVSEVLDAQESPLEEGDILMLRTGYPRVLSTTPVAARPRSWPGLSPDEDMARFLWDNHVAAVVADNPAVETAPGDPKSFLHRRLIPMLGMALGEYFYLEDLAADCATDGRYACFFVAVPLKIPGAVGSPGNAMAIK
jgi:kynurenine formamidase